VTGCPALIIREEMLRQEGGEVILIQDYETHEFKTITMCTDKSYTAIFHNDFIIQHSHDDFKKNLRQFWIEICIIFEKPESAKCVFDNHVKHYLLSHWIHAELAF